MKIRIFERMACNCGPEDEEREYAKLLLLVVNATTHHGTKAISNESVKTS
jgi:hypothetical protein